jgi:hypothetical protein
VQSQPGVAGTLTEHFVGEFHHEAHETHEEKQVAKTFRGDNRMFRKCSGSILGGPRSVVAASSTDATERVPPVFVLSMFRQPPVVIPSEVEGSLNELSRVIKRKDSFTDLAGTMPLTGESARLACCRRRLGDDHRVVRQGTPFGFSNRCRRMCSAGRRTPRASGLRSPFQLNRSG